VLIGGHDPARWKTTPTRPGIARLSIAGAPADLAPALARAASVARWTNRARELVDAPPNEMTPEGLARATTALFEGLPIDVEVLDLAAIEREGMRALAAVGRGSANEPRLIVLRYRPGTAPVASLGLIGKGVTFDSGGLFLKQQSDIVRQKADMGGAAAVIAAVGALAELQVGVGILAVIPAAENMLDGAAFRPGDILTTAAGLTVEVTNPDAEGRLLLAEGIWYAKREGADRLVDIATLTGAMRGGMGDMFSGVFANEIEWRSRIVQAGRASGDHAWPWPMHRRYDRPLESQLADLRSTAGRSFGYPIFAAAFLARFAGTTPWAHVDIHSTALLDEARGYLGAGATGAGVRLLVELAAGLSSPT
jgi:leucyl aminopeptidase